MSSYWANFIKTGNPNGTDLPHWPSVKENPAMAFEGGDKYPSIPVAGSAEKQALLEKAIKNPPPGGRGRGRQAIAGRHAMDAPLFYLKEELWQLPLRQL